LREKARIVVAEHGIEAVGEPLRDDTEEMPATRLGDERPRELLWRVARQA
jgi:hypothetical protein